MANGQTILELGCGDGRDSQTLVHKCKHHVATDIRQHTLVDNAKRMPASTFIHANHHQALPFKDNSFDLIVASLCLHYCCLRRARLIARELRRVAVDKAVFLGRLNSTNDQHFGACPGAGSRLYTVDQSLKRFYNADDVATMLADNWQLHSLHEKQIQRYTQAKMVWEFMARA